MLRWYITEDRARELRWWIGDRLMDVARRLVSMAARLLDDREWSTTPGEWRRHR